MSDLNVPAVRPPARAIVPAAVAGTFDRQDDPLVATDGLETRRYIVFGEVPGLALRAPVVSGVQLRGTSPTGERWSATRLTTAEARSLEALGYRVHEDLDIRVPPTLPSRGVVTPDVFTREVHEARQLNALGPEWEGEGGLYISADSGVARHRDLPLAEHFDNVFTESPEDPQADLAGHGTHTTGSAIGRGDPEHGGGVRGMAPRASLAAVQVLDAQGRGTSSAALLGVQRAVEWARQHDGFVVVNMSLSGRGSGDPAEDPLYQAIQAATREHGILFVLAAGNQGPESGTIGWPGHAPLAVTVGAIDHNGTLDPADDRVPSFSSRDVPGGAKPTIVAHGVNVRSTLPNDGYGIRDGTSMATAIAGGGMLALGQGLLAMYRRGELSVDPRDLVRRGELQEIVAATAYDNPRAPRHVEGGGDLRLMRARELVLQRYATRAPSGR